MIKTGEKIKKKGDRSPDRRGRDKDRMKMLKRGLTSFDPKIVESMMNSEKGQKENKRSSTLKEKKKLILDKKDTMCKDEHDHEYGAQKLALITYFQNMPSGSFDIQKKKMKKKLDLLVDQNNTKENKLEQLYLQLGQMAYINLEGEQTK